MEQNQKLKLFGTRDFSGNFDMTFSFIKQNYGKILKSLLIFIPFMMIGVYFVPNTNSMFMSDLSGYDNPLDIYGEIFTPGFLLYYLFTLVAILCVSIYTVAYMGIYSQSADGVVNSSDVWRKVKRTVLPLIGAGILFGIVATIGFMLCIIPGIIVYVYLGFYIYAIVIEEKGVIDALQRSYDLVRDNFWLTLGYGLVFLIVFYIASSILSALTLFSTLGAVLQIEFLTSDIFNYIANLISSVGTFLLYPFLYIAMGVLYFSHRNKLEGTDLESEIDNIGSSQNNNDIHNF